MGGREHGVGAFSGILDHDVAGIVDAIGVVAAVPDHQVSARESIEQIGEGRTAQRVVVWVTGDLDCPCKNRPVKIVRPSNSGIDNGRIHMHEQGVGGPDGRAGLRHDVVASRQLDHPARRLDSDPREDVEVVAGGSGVTGTQVEESARRDVRRDSQRAGAREYLRVPAGVR